MAPLLIFKTNSSYSRWWEARTLWGRAFHLCRAVMRLVRGRGGRRAQLADGSRTPAGGGGERWTCAALTLLPLLLPPPPWHVPHQPAEHRVRGAAQPRAAAAHPHVVGGLPPRLGIPPALPPEGLPGGPPEQAAEPGGAGLAQRARQPRRHGAAGEWCRQVGREMGGCMGRCGASRYERSSPTATNPRRRCCPAR